jgi:thiol-disulfide isomerase/thioredoxin
MMVRLPAAVLVTAAIVFSIGVCAVAAAPKVQYATATTIKTQIAADKGRVVLVNFWATWCPPCVAEYPELVKLDRTYKANGMDVIAVSLDLHDDIAGKVLPFVTRQKATFTQYVLEMDDPEKAIDSFDPSWQGDLPRTLIYSRTGKLIQILADAHTYPQFQKAVGTALAAHS